MAMWRYGPTIATVLFVLSALFNTITLSGATRIPGVGDGIRKVAHAEALLTYIYIRSGDLLNQVGVGGESAKTFAEATLGAGLERIRQQNRLAIDVIYGPAQSKAHGWLVLSLYACPWLLLLAIALHAFKPKRFETFGKKR